MAAPEIAFDLTPLQNAHRYRGIGTYVRGLAQRLAAQTEIPIEFWSWEGAAPIDTPPPHTSLAIRRPPMPQYRGAWLFARFGMRMRSRRSGARAVHITDPDAVTTLAGRRLLVTVYDLIPLKQGLRTQRALARMGYESYLKCLHVAEILFAISGQTAEDLVGMLRIPARRIQVARPGIDLQPESPDHARRPRPYFLYLGGPNPNKNLGVVLDAMTQSADLAEELVVGGHWLDKQVAALEGSLAASGLRERVTFAGFVPPGELAALMREATAVVVPSLLEGFGLPVAEGMAAGAAVVHSRLPVLEETSAGAALTFDPRSASELASCLHVVAGDPKRAADLRKRGLERAAALSWDAAVKTTLAAYASAVGA